MPHVRRDPFSHFIRQCLSPLRQAESERAYQWGGIRLGAIVLAIVILLLHLIPWIRDTTLNVVNQSIAQAQAKTVAVSIVGLCIVALGWGLNQIASVRTKLEAMLPIGGWIANGIIGACDAVISLGEWCIDNRGKALILSFTCFCVAIASAGLVVGDATRYIRERHPYASWISAVTRYVATTQFRESDVPGGHQLAEQWKRVDTGVLSTAEKELGNALAEALEALKAEPSDSALTLARPIRLLNSANVLEYAAMPAVSGELKVLYATRALMIGKALMRAAPRQFGSATPEAMRIDTALTRFERVLSRIGTDYGVEKAALARTGTNLRGIYHSRIANFHLAELRQHPDSKKLAPLIAKSVIDACEAFGDVKDDDRETSLYFLRARNNILNILIAYSALPPPLRQAVAGGHADFEWPVDSKALSKRLRDELEKFITRVSDPELRPGRLATIAQGFCVLASLADVDSTKHSFLMASGNYMRMAWVLSSPDDVEDMLGQLPADEFNAAIDASHQLEPHFRLGIDQTFLGAKAVNYERIAQLRGSN